MRKALGVALFLGALAAPQAWAGGEGWVVRDQLGSPEAVRELCADLADAGVDGALLQVRGRGDAYYRSRLVPRSEFLDRAPAGFDPLGEALAACGGRPLTAWLNVFLVWGGDAQPKDAAHVTRAHSDWLVRDGAGRSTRDYTAEDRARGWLEGPYADPASPEYRAHFAAVAAELAKTYPVAGVHLDFIRYPGPDYGQSGPLGKRFQALYGFDPRLIPAEFGNVDLPRWLSDATAEADRFLVSAKLLWAGMRSEEVTALVRSARAALLAARPGVALSAAVFPDASAAFLEKGQDWRAWAEEGLVDALYPMAYFGRKERVEGQLRAVRDAVRGAALVNRKAVALKAGLGAYLKEPADIAQEALAARDAGFDGVALFDVGTLRKKKTLKETFAGLPAFAPASAKADLPPTPSPQAPLQRAYDRARTGGEPTVAEALPLLLAREAQFHQTLPLAAEVQKRLESDGIDAPAWGELRGVFRYVHPLDSAERKAEQRAQCQLARDRIAAGEPMDKVAAELSQDATKAFGGRLGRVYAQGTGLREQAVRGLSPGGLSEVLEAPNGFWVFSLDKTGLGEKMAFRDAPTALQRAAFRDALQAALQQSATPRKPE